jgi:hypothetical protein
MINKYILTAVIIAIALLGFSVVYAGNTVTDTTQSCGCGSEASPGSCDSGCSCGCQSGGTCGCNKSTGSSCSLK